MNHAPRPAERHAERQAERGNVMFYIFLAVALFGALSFAVSQSSRNTGDSGIQQQNRLRATEIIDYGDTVAKGVGMLRLRGVSLATLSFSSTGTTEKDVFAIDGGGVNLRRPSSDVTTTGTETYQILTGNAVNGVGTTCTLDSCTEILLVLAQVKLPVCTAINQLAGINPPDYAPPYDADFDVTHPYTGTLNYTKTLSAAPLTGQMYGCFTVSTADPKNYYYYRVLVQQ
ncbi:MAG: hypothetical protein JWO78_1415 [Micavibrio sp.]|nr:hypothetical protein [Micavibrio sp.]